MSGRIPRPSRRWEPKPPIPPRRPLYLQIKPAPDAAARIAALTRNDPGRDAGLLHMTVLALVDLTEWSDEFIPAFHRTMEGFEAGVFDVQFDRIVERKAVTLRASRRQKGALALQWLLRAHFEARDFRFFGKAPDPHVTINYKGDGKGNETIAPLGWTVEEILLVESVHGETRHVEHGRWPLRRRLL
jgi:RNA 2',3'-cyclic 3'-phosphodiesterase